jgi:4-hydroxy 2-oxovalerate aldolase
MTIRIVDSSLRDGMHSFAHQFTPDQVTAIVSGLDESGVAVAEVCHGDGLGGSSIQYGLARATDADLIGAAVEAAERTEIAVLLLPGIGTLTQLRAARELGVSVARVATHCTEADIGQQHISWARENGMTTVGFLMMSHMIEPRALAEQARLMESYGAHAVYVVDSAGALVPAGARSRVAALRQALACEVGFHAHNNLGCAVGNSIAAVEEGATWLDGSLRGLGAGAGNAQLEVLAAALERSGYATGVDIFVLMDVAEEVVAPLMSRPQVIDQTALTLGYAGVYSSFLLHAERAARKYQVPEREILLELGRRRIVGGQEDMIVEVAAELSASRALERVQG